MEGVGGRGREEWRDRGRDGRWEGWKQGGIVEREGRSDGEWEGRGATKSEKKQTLRKKRIEAMSGKGK